MLFRNIKNFTMGILGKFFKKEKTEEEKKIEKIQEGGTKVEAVLIDNVFKCNNCGEEIEGKPRFISHQGRRLVFHKRCLKQLSMGNL